MNRFLLSFAAAAVVSTSLYGADSDPGNGYRGSLNEKYYRPTQRYYGDGYTIAYRFVPWKERTRTAPTQFEIQQLEAVPARSVVGKNSPNPRAVKRWRSTPAVSAPGKKR